MNFLRNFIRFSRLHTIIGTSISIIALYCLALSFSDFQQLHLDVLGLTLLSCLGANIYIVGLNQITDVEIDQINKPYLPLASGAFSMSLGYILVASSVLLSIAIAMYFGRYLLLTVILSLLLGTAYSLPPFRLKRFTFWAAFCIIVVRGLIVNLFLFLHFHFTLNELETIPPLVWLLTATIFGYSMVIAWFKDIPDMKGDQFYRIRTLTLRLGAKKVFWIGNGLLSLFYLVLIILPFHLPLQVHTPSFVFLHVLLFLLLWTVNLRVNLDIQSSVRLYYQFIWVLFFIEYICFAVTGLIGYR